MSATRVPGPKRPGPRGWRGPYQGEWTYLQAPEQFRATNRQVCGLWPWVNGTGSPMIGVPLGPNLDNGTTVCFDEISWYLRAKMISVPTKVIIGKVGLGKSSLQRRILLGQYGYGHMPLVFGDLKGEYVDLTRAIDGQVISLGPGAGYLNILDPGEAWAAAKRLTGALRQQVLEDAHTRRRVGVAGLITIAREAKPTVREETIVDRALRVLDDRWDFDRDGAYVLRDLLRVIREAPDQVRAVAIDRQNRDKYDDIVEDLEVALLSLISGGPLGDMFAEQTTEPMRHDAPVCFDVSRLQAVGSQQMKAAGLFTCWTYGMGSVNVAHTLADAGLEPRRVYSMTLDELWEVWRVGHGMPARVDGLLRTNRTTGVAVTLITHSMADADTLPTPEDREIARSMVEKAGAVVLSGLPRREMPFLEQVVGLSQAEQAMLMSWQDPPPVDPVTGTLAEPPGRGKFLIKVGSGSGQPGIPVRVRKTRVEAALDDTAKRWQEVVDQVGRVADLPPVDSLPDPRIPEATEVVDDPAVDAEDEVHPGEPEEGPDAVVLPLKRLRPVPPPVAVAPDPALEALLADGDALDPNDRQIVEEFYRSRGGR